jgi:hypothetical protein
VPDIPPDTLRLLRRLALPFVVSLWLVRCGSCGTRTSGSTPSAVPWQSYGTPRLASLRSQRFKKFSALCQNSVSNSQRPPPPSYRRFYEPLPIRGGFPCTGLAGVSPSTALPLAVPVETQPAAPARCGQRDTQLSYSPHGEAGEACEGIHGSGIGASCSRVNGSAASGCSGFRCAARPILGPLTERLQIYGSN